MRVLGTVVVLFFVIAQPIGAQLPLDSLLADTERDQLFKWCYPGGEMEPGEMRFWSNGLLEVDAQTLSAGKETRYLTWSWATTDSSEIRLVFLDRRIRFETLLSIERTHTYISKYDEQARSITYKTLTPTRDAIFLGNWRFDRRYCRD